jgi:hypothetical protein
VQDQQVLEARRARDEKEDRLRAALDSAAALKEELESLKSLRCPVALCLPQQVLKLYFIWSMVLNPYLAEPLKQRR